MKSLSYKIFFTLAVIISFTACKKNFDDYSQNKNLPLTVLASGVLANDTDLPVHRIQLYLLWG